MQSDGKIIGIDFGTTNSVVAIVEGSEPQVIRSPEGDNKIPSIVGFLDNGEVVVGEKARRQAVTNPRRTVSSVKRLLGRSFEDVEESGDVFPYEIVNSDGSLLIDIDGMGYRPEQIGGLILRRIREIAESYAGEEITRAVITVPAYFDDLQRQSTIEAAKMAGLEVLRLINEPTAAAMAYGLGRSSDKEEIIAVYDFGGGTFDITILEISEKTFEVLCSTGDSHLGGDDLDNLIVNRIVEEFYNEHGLDLSKDPAVLRRLKEVAEKAKIELSSSKSARMSLPFFAQKDGQPIHLERSMDRDELEELIEPLVNRTIRCCRKALEDAGLSKKDVSKVVLVGGSTRIPLVQDAIEDFFGAAPFKGVNPDEVVALGAAAQAGVFEGNIQEVVLLDVTPHSLGIEVKDGKFSPIIEKNSTIPIKAAKTFTTTEANQSYVNIHILQGESTEAAENRSLGKFSLTNIPPAPAGVPRIRVTFFINADGVTEISASDLGSGIEKSLTVLHQQLNSDERSNRKRKRERSTKKLGGSMSTRRGAARIDGSGTKARTSSPGDTASLGGTPLRRPEPEKPKSDTQPMVPQSFAEISDSNPGALPPAAAAQQRAQEKLGTPAELVPPQRPMIATTASGEVPNLTPLPLPRRDSKADNPLPPLAPPPPGPSAAPAAQDSDDLPTTIESPLGSAAPVPPPPPRTAPAAPAPVLAATTPAAEDVPLPPAVESARADLLAKVDSPASQAAYLGALKALDLEPYKSSRAYNVIAMRTRLQIAAGQSEEARESLKQLREAHLRTNVTELRELHDLALDRFAGTASIRRDRALLREMLSDWIGAADDIEQATRQDPNEGDTQILERVYKARMMEATDPGVQFKLVKIFLRTNRMDEAIEILQSLQRFESYQQRAVKILGLCHWQQNLHYLAWQKFKQLDLNDELKDILYRLAGDMERTEQLKNAVSVYEHLLANDPNYRDAAAKLKKLNFRLKLQDGEEDSPKVAGVLKDPRFTVIEEINRGSMGIIYKAKDKTLDEIVALKVLNDFLCQDPAAVERFKREARAAKKLSHPYIVRIHDMFESGSKRFISMEYIEGTDLKRLQAERTSITEEMILYYMDQIGDAMAYAHRLGVVHRDLKPANIMVTKQNVIKITDFGIAKLLKGEDGTKSGTAVIGTPLYMAPEQITGAGVDERSDIYSLGIVMYELASGNPPFYLGNIEYHHIHTAPPPLPDRVSPGLRAVILKAIEKDPAARYQNVDELLADLRKLRTTTGVPTN